MSVVTLAKKRTRRTRRRELNGTSDTTVVSLNLFTVSDRRTNRLQRVREKVVSSSSTSNVKKFFFSEVIWT